MSIWILGGFLGAGKTTLLLQLAKQLAWAHRNRRLPLVIVENEIGDVSVDGGLLGDYQLRELFSGCVCCTLASGLAQCIRQLRQEENPGCILIETTGLALPKSVVQVLETYVPEEGRPNVLVVADAQRWDELFDCMDVFLQNQLERADGILLNKTDLVSPEDTQRICGEIQHLRPGVPVWPVCGQQDNAPLFRQILEEALP